MYYCLLELHMRPKDFVNMDDNEKAFIFASVEKKVKTEEKIRREMKMKAEKSGKSVRYR